MLALAGFTYGNGGEALIKTPRKLVHFGQFDVG